LGAFLVILGRIWQVDERIKEGKLKVMDQIFESRIGKLFVIFYALFALGVYMYAFYCGDSACGLYIVLPILPWASILTQDFGISFPWAVYPIFILLNASVAYIIGAGIEWTYNRYLDFKEARKLRELDKAEVIEPKT